MSNFYLKFHLYLNLSHFFIKFINCSLFNYKPANFQSPSKIQKIAETRRNHRNPQNRPAPWRVQKTGAGPAAQRARARREDKGLSRAVPDARHRNDPDAPAPGRARASLRLSARAAAPAARGRRDGAAGGALRLGARELRARAAELRA